MNKQDKFFEQFKEAAQQTEQHRFPGFEDVWQQVETRLDKEEKPKKIPFNAKRILAIAAALLAIVIVGAIYFQHDRMIEPPLAVDMKDKPVNNAIAKSLEEMDTIFSPKELTNKANENTTARKINTGSIIDPVPAKEQVLLAQKELNELVKSGRDSGKGSEVVNQKDLALDGMIYDSVQNASNHQAGITPSETGASTAQEVWVKGLVTDQNGNPVEGATVVVNSNQRILVTNSKGAFYIKADTTDELAVNAVGYSGEKIIVGENAEINITLKEDMASLQDVVVTGYRTRKKVSVSVSTSTVVGQQISRSKKSASVANMLQGSVAGIQVNPGNRSLQNVQQYSIPGASTEIRIRGIASLNAGNDPLVIVNGSRVKGDALNTINPDQIDNIQILKDTSAMALYGAIARNGVILIKTKNLRKRTRKKLDELNEKLKHEGISINGMPIPSMFNNNNEAYNPLIENPFTSPKISPLSTFSIDVDNASYANIRRFINNGQAVPKDAVRIEEMINYFKYQYTAPKDDQPFAWQTEYSDAPWNPSHKLLRIALKAKDIPMEALPSSNIVFLIDVSGSMEDPNKLPLLRSSMKVLVDQLREQDKVSMVVYAGAAGLVLPPTSGNQKQTIMDALDRLSAGGSTAGGAGIELAYKTAAENFIKGGNNRVVLATDGDFNVGISSQGDLQTLIEAKRKSGIFLTCLGFGMGNYKDNTLETLADKGNGNYAYIDNMQESNRFLGKEFKGSMYTVAKDVKLQIEFNPAQVQSYRLIGYENRMLHDEDFVNDKIDAGEMGVGHTVTALYEIIPVGVQSSFLPSVPALKYTNPQMSQGNSQELATLKFRYKKPDGDSSTESVQVIANTAHALQKASEDFRFAAAVAWFGLKLRNSDLIANKEMRHIIQLAKGASSFDPDGYRAECIRLMELAK